MAANSMILHEVYFDNLEAIRWENAVKPYDRHCSEA